MGEKNIGKKICERCEIVGKQLRTYHEGNDETAADLPSAFVDVTGTSCV